VGGTCSTNGGDEKYINLGWKTWREEPLGRSSSRCKYNIRLDVRVGRCGLDWSGSE